MMSSKPLWTNSANFVLLSLVLFGVISISAAENDYTTKNYTTKNYTTKKYTDSIDDYGQDVVDYNKDDDNSGVDEYGYSTDPDGESGVDPNPYGQDYGDTKPFYDPRDSMIVSLDMWIDSAHDWEQRSKNRYGSYRGKKPYRKQYRNEKYDDNSDYEKRPREKRSYKKVTFPVRHYKDIRRFPLKKFPPLFSTFPWLPIFYDKLTYQTFIFSPTGGVYVLPPLVNFFGRRFAVAQLIKWGYASLVSTGIPPPPAVNVAPLVTPAAAGTTSAVGFNPNNGRFNGAVNFDPSKPQYAKYVKYQSTKY